MQTLLLLLLKVNHKESCLWCEKIKFCRVIKRMQKLSYFDRFDENIHVGSFLYFFFVNFFASTNLTLTLDYKTDRKSTPCTFPVNIVD